MTEPRMRLAKQLAAVAHLIARNIHVENEVYIDRDGKVLSVRPHLDDHITHKAVAVLISTLAAAVLLLPGGDPKVMADVADDLHAIAHRLGGK